MSSDKISCTPFSDQLEVTRKVLGQVRTPAYGDALALCRKFEAACTNQSSKSYKEELDLSTVRKALERNRSITEPNTLYLSWVELDALYRIVGINKE